MKFGLTGLLLLASLPIATAQAAGPPAACPPEPTRVVRSAGGVIDYTGTVPGIPELCHLIRGDGPGDFYYGSWRSDWPGAGQAYPAIRAVVTGPKGTRVSFVTRSYPGFQFDDSYVNEGVETLVVDGKSYSVLRVAHERNGIDGNTYHSIITSWRDVLTGISLKALENQISGQSYGPATTWIALKVQPLP